VVWSGLLTATMATLGQVLPPERRADGLSVYGLAGPAGVIFGPLAGLAVFQRWGFAPMTWSLCLTFLGLGLVALSLPRDPGRHQPRAAFQLPGRAMLAPALVLLVTALGYGAVESYTAQEGLALGFRTLAGIPTAAAFLCCMSLGMVLIRLFMIRVGFGPNPTRLLPAMLWATASGLILLTLLPGGLPRHIISALLYGGGYSMVHTLVNAHVLDTTPPDRRGAAFGATLFAFDSGIGLGSLAIGGLIGWGSGPFGALGFRLGWAAAAALALAAVPLSRGLRTCHN